MSPSYNIIENEYNKSDYNIDGAYGTIGPHDDEAYYDNRSDATDDIEKGRLKFPKRIYGRERELETLLNIYDELATGAKSSKKQERRLSSIFEDEEDGEEPPAADLYSSHVVFLSGYSGIGKSALVKEFAKQADAKFKNNIQYTSGKYTEKGKASKLLRPVLTEILDKLVVDICKNEQRHKLVLKGIKESELIGPDTEGNRVLQKTFPCLVPILDEKGSSSSLTTATTIHPSMNAINECIREIMSIISQTLEHPMIIFIDDVQWAGKAALNVLQFLLSCTKSEMHTNDFMIICAYRSNEVDENHPFAKLMRNVIKTRGSKSLEQMDLFNLSPQAITRFIADSIRRGDDDDADDNKDNKEVRELSEAVYKKTMGNIFFTMQALEELVRKNVLYFDVMCFEWRFVVSKVELAADLMSDDVVTMVKSKIMSLSSAIRHLLIVMSYIPNAVDASILKPLLSYWEASYGYDVSSIERLLKDASKEGMLLRVDKTYIFAHDRIREASHEIASEKADRYMIILHVSLILRDIAELEPHMEWCLYVAVDLLNLLPLDKTINLNDLVKLNVKVAKIARSRGSIGKESELLHKALKCLESSGKMWSQYDQAIELYNAVIMSDHSLGSYDSAMLSIQKVLQNACSLDDKLEAYIYQMLCTIGETSDYARGLNMGLSLLKLYGVDISRNISKAYMTKEEVKMKMILKNRSYSSLANLPVVNDVPIVRLIMEVQQFALFTSHEQHVTVLAWRAIQHAMKYGMDKHLPSVVALLAQALANQGKVKTAQELGHFSLDLCDKIPDDINSCAITRFIIHGAVVTQLQSFQDSVEPLLQCHKDLKLQGGMTNFMFGSMLNHFQAYFAAGLELGPILESKLVLAENQCQALQQPGFLTNFQISRQLALNLRTRTNNPTKLYGDAFREEEELSKLNSNKHKMALRDSSAARLQLAFIFWDEDAMIKMLDILKNYTICDVSLARLHNRLCFVGLAAFALDTRKCSKAILKLRQGCLTWFYNLAKLGSVNAAPVYLFMLALKGPSRKSYLKAIDACAEADMVHLEAPARERFAAFLRTENNLELAKEQITSSYWLYRDWGAYAKALDLSQQYVFIKNSTREQADTVTSSVMSGTARRRTHIINTTLEKQMSRTVVS